MATKKKTAKSVEDVAPNKKKQAKAAPKKRAAAKKKAKTKKTKPKKAKQTLLPKVKIGHRPPPTLKQMNLLCERLIENGSLKNVCESYDDMPNRKTVYRWLLKGMDDNCDDIYKTFSHNYAQARELATDYAFDELMHTLNDIAYQPVVIEGVVLMMPDDKGEMVVVKQVTQTSLGMAKLFLEAYKWKASKERPTKYSDKHQELIGGAQTLFSGNVFNIQPVKAIPDIED